MSNNDSLPMVSKRDLLADARQIIDTARANAVRSVTSIA